jgi:hypothetical protein
VKFNLLMRVCEKLSVVYVAEEHKCGYEMS